ncbi:MAG: hypothetical protein Q8M08_08520 [Bacteroidales bacterium]|nr:hypothetical protein [Bacteroidales bacterium]
MYPSGSHLGQQDELFAVSQVVVIVVSHSPEDPGGQHASLFVVWAGLTYSFTAMIPIADKRIIPKIIFARVLFLFGGQQLPSQPQSP